MSVNIISRATPSTLYCQRNDKGSQQPCFGMKKKNSKKPSNSLKAASLLCSMGGTSIAILNIAKKQKIQIFKTKKITDIFKNISKLKYKETEIIKMALGSVLGGLTAGLVFDPENKKSKFMEATQQMVGNILIPIGCVSATVNFLKKHKIKPENTNKIAQNIINVGGTLGALFIGITVGNLVTNKINDFIFNKKCKRKIELADFSAHLDDVGLASILVAPENKFSKLIGNVIPIALLMPGYQTGIDKTKVENQ